MTKPYSEMTPAERLQHRIAMNREIDAKVEKVLEAEAKQKKLANSFKKAARAARRVNRWNDQQITDAINHFRVEVGMSPIVTFRTNRGIF